MASADSFAIELPPVPTQSLEGLDSNMIPLFDDAMLSGFVGSSFVSAPEESPHLSPSGYSPSHAIPSPQPVEGTQDVTGSSSDELAHGRSGIIQKLPKQRIGAFEELAVKLEDDGSGSGGANDDDRDQKRQRRLMKNRESAQLSRQRKKVYVEELEKKVAQLQRTNEEAMKKNVVLNKENAALRDEVARLTQHLKAASARPVTSSKSAKAAGVCLLVVLFSFGIIFNQTQRLPFEDSLASVRARYIGRTLASTETKRVTKDDEEMMPVVANPSIAAPVHIQVKADDQAGLAQTDAKLRAPVQGSIHNIGSIADRARFVSSKERRSVFGDAKDRTSASSPLDAFDPTSFQEQKRRNTVKLVTEQQQQQQQHATTVMSDDDTPAVIQPLASKADSKDVVAVNDLVPYHVSLPHGAATRTRPVTQYFFCPEAQRLTPTNGESPADVPPNYVALLIPGEMLNSTFAPPNSLVEVTCSVASMSIYPNYRAPLPEEEQPTALQRA